MTKIIITLTIFNHPTTASKFCWNKIIADYLVSAVGFKINKILNLSYNTLDWLNNIIRD